MFLKILQVIMRGIIGVQGRGWSILREDRYTHRTDMLPPSRDDDYSSFKARGHLARLNETLFEG